MKRKGEGERREEGDRKEEKESEMKGGGGKRNLKGGRWSKGRGVSSPLTLDQVVYDILLAVNQTVNVY